MTKESTFGCYQFCNQSSTHYLKAKEKDAVGYYWKNSQVGQV
jgi:hypothetical protein